MSTSDRDVFMASPPTSPRPSVPHTEKNVDTSPPMHPMSVPVPTTSSPPPHRRFQPPIQTSSAPAFAPLPVHAPAPFAHNIFKPKTSRPTSTPAQRKQPQQQQQHPQPAHHPRPVQSQSRFNPLHNPLPRAPGNAVTSPPPSSMKPLDSQRSSPKRDSAQAALHGRPMKRTAPLQIPQPDLATSSAASPPTRPRLATSATVPHRTSLHTPLASSLTIPQSVPNVSPSYPATLFGGLSADDEHVTVWEPHTGKTVAGNAAPYRRNLSTWLKGHAGWEEKADELKSSKRRSAARRSKNAAEAFAALCCFPVATFVATEAAKYLQVLGDGDHCNEDVLMMWTNDDFVRLQEALFRLGQDCHNQSPNSLSLGENDWANVTSQIGGAKMEGTVVYCAHHMLTRGISKSQRELMGLPLPNSFGSVSMSIPEAGVLGSPGSLSPYDNLGSGGSSGEGFSGASSMPTLHVGLGASFLERSFRAPREPRVTVWNPSNGRTISGNAAPCRRNLDAWMRQHPGWEPKEETQLSSSRRNRKGKTRTSGIAVGTDATPSSVEPESPLFHEALEGLLHLSKSPSAVSPPSTSMDEQVERVGADHGSPSSTHMDSVQGRGEEVDRQVAKKVGMTSSVSSSSAEDGRGVMSDGEEADNSKMEL